MITSFNIDTAHFYKIILSIMLQFRKYLGNYHGPRKKIF